IAIRRRPTRRARKERACSKRCFRCLRPVTPHVPGGRAVIGACAAAAGHGLIGANCREPRQGGNLVTLRTEKLISTVLESISLSTHFEDFAVRGAWGYSEWPIPSPLRRPRYKYPKQIHLVRNSTRYPPLRFSSPIFLYHSQRAPTLKYEPSKNRAAETRP